MLTQLFLLCGDTLTKQLFRILLNQRAEVVLLMTMLVPRMFSRSKIYFIGTVAIVCVYVLLFILTDSPSNTDYNQQLPFSAVSVVSSTTFSSVKNITKKHSSKTKKHNRRTSHPWRDDPECKHFTVQVLRGMVQTFYTSIFSFIL